MAGVPLSWALLSWGVSPPVRSAEPSPPATAGPTTSKGFIEAGATYHELTAGFGEWRGGYVRGTWEARPGSVFNAELVEAQRFGEGGTYAAVGLTRSLDQRWYVSGTVGAGDGAFFWPRWRADVAVNRKWLDDLSLVTTIGYSHYAAPDGHVDRTPLLALTWYAPGDLVFETGFRSNRSSPGDVRSNAGYLAATWGREGEQYLALRHDRGREAYQTIGPDTQLVDFPSRATSLTWRRWITPRCGYNIRIEHYRNPTYQRTGGDAGVFCGF